jgi:hypothetical protein
VPRGQSDERISRHALRTLNAAESARDFAVNGFALVSLPANFERDADAQS